MTVTSNDIIGTIKGNYQLTKLPSSVQYYLSKYLPNYIKAPSKTPPEQDLTFEIRTRDIDSLFSVTYPTVRGFDNSSISGSLNTKQKKLTLVAKSPYGAIGKYSFYNVNITGDGNLDLLELNTEVEHVIIGDSILSSSLSVTTTLGNDSLNFNIATSAPEAYTSASINGQAVAYGDTLYLKLKPSEFFLNQTKWNIPAGNSAIVSHNFLSIKDLRLESGIQNITISSDKENTEQLLSLQMSNIDLGQFGAWSGISAYQPDGRINGNISISHIFKNYKVDANIKATGVKFGTDTLGTINIVATYDGTKQEILLDPQTSIFKDNASVSASGFMSFNKQVSKQLDGTITANNVPVSWISPLLIGYASHVKGTANGSINISGTSDAPDIVGSIKLDSGGARIDYLGTYYTIPSANITVSSSKFDLGEVTVYDSYKNKAFLTGNFSHSSLKNMQMHLKFTSDKFEAFNLKQYENNIFYGNLIASFSSVNITGPFNNVNININTAAPAGKSHIFIPVSSGTDLNTYSYVSFVSYGKDPAKTNYKNRSKLALTLNNCRLNQQAEMTIILDEATGDAINAKGYSDNLTLEMPANNDMRIFGNYNIDLGDYTFTFKQLKIKRTFKINSGSTISFNGPFSQTNLDIKAMYETKTNLYDLLNDNEKSMLNSLGPANTNLELADTKQRQPVDVLLFMKGSLDNPKLTFNITLPETHSIGNYAYKKLESINSSPQQFDQVASLLLVGYFIPPEGVVARSAQTGAINNISDILSTTASSGLTQITNKILGNPDITVDFRYSQYNYGDISNTGINRNIVSLGLRKEYLNNRLSVELGGKSDWGRPLTAANQSNTTFGIAGDFRVQYQLKENGRLRLNVFRTSDYGLTQTLNEGNISRSGIGLTWKKSFNSLYDFFHDTKSTPVADTSKEKK